MFCPVWVCWAGLTLAGSAPGETVRQGGAAGFGHPSFQATRVDPAGHLRLDWDRGAMGVVSGNRGHVRAVPVPLDYRLEGVPAAVSARASLDVLFDGGRTRGLRLDRVLQLRFHRPVWVSQIRLTTEARPKPDPATDPAATAAWVSWDGRTWHRVAWRAVSALPGTGAKPTWLTVDSTTIDRPARWVRLRGGYVCEVEVWGSATCCASGQMTSDMVDLGGEQVVTAVEVTVTADRQSLARLAPARQASVRPLPPPSGLHVAGTLRWDASARSDFPANATLYYGVTAVGPGGESAPTPLVQVDTGDPAPQVVDLRWSATPGATAYRVYRGVQPNRLALVAAMEAPTARGAETRLLDMGYAEATKQVPPTKGTAAAPTVPRGVEATVRPGAGHLVGGRYYYRVSAEAGQGETRAGEAAMVHVRAPGSAVELRWIEVPGATGYRVFRSRRVGDFGNTFLARTGPTPRFTDTGRHQPGCHVGGFVRVGTTVSECLDGPWQALPLARGRAMVGRFVQYRLVMSTALRTASPVVSDVAVRFRRQWPAPVRLSDGAWKQARTDRRTHWLDLGARARRQHFLVMKGADGVRVVSSGAGVLSWGVDRGGRWRPVVVIVDSGAGDEVYAMYHNDRLVGKFWAVANDDALYAWRPAGALDLHVGDVLTLHTIGPRLGFYTVVGWGMEGGTGGE